MITPLPSATSVQIYAVLHERRHLRLSPGTYRVTALVEVDDLDLCDHEFLAHVAAASGTLTLPVRDRSA